MSERVVLAFSGGLDTSYCVLALKEQGFEVHTAFVDTGGIGADQKAWIAGRARALGAVEHHELDAGQPLWDQFVVPLLWSGARMLEQYPMLCSDRYVIVQECLKLADELGTTHFAHGCTGMGNDQLRFDQSVRSLGDYTIHAPIRELQRETSNVRAHELKLMADAGVEVPESASRYSINENLLGVTLSGQEIDEFGVPDEDTHVWCRPRSEWPDGPLELTLGFREGRAVSLDDQPLDGPDLLAALNDKLGAYGVGRHIYTGDVSIGLKGRIVFECPGIDGLMVAQRALREAVNTKLQNQFHQAIAQRWAELVYTGFFFEPHKADLEAYLESANEYVTGVVRLSSDGGDIQAVAVGSRYLLKDPDAVYAQSAGWTPEEAEGFVKLLGQSSTLAARIRKR
ncbi:MULTISPECIES: argininosuccinate synthase domain-containing protein [unclassified Wenzhouxiangella]|uniref:argininosuccinate synthase domain-containing protein n=1 Tax=unclassified Wenzhouxiangella TaxID=2613841 RepID=UPI000E32751C|nr:MULTISPECIES: argininosuccinate synthase domain-containing protein [unclassified Wenzhouxiangella]RFF26927.1 argininosuccinate synthase [Wenzhouxiangella sp. 15181]RFP69440.1 argininosuccinate synthase [Wenzhouxiangella sp. 15190]